MRLKTKCLVITTWLLLLLLLLLKVKYPSKHSSWWRRLEDVFHLRLQETSPRRLQDVLIKRNIFVLVIRLQKKISSRRHAQDQYIRFGHTSSRRLQNLFKTSYKIVFKTSSRRLAKMFSRRFQEVSSSSTVLVNASSRRIQHVSETSCKDVYLQKDLPKSHSWET